MIIDAKSIVLTLIVVLFACYGALQFVSQCALQIAQENHDAIRVMDAAQDEVRLKKERAVDAASEYDFINPRKG